jgi:hypothetical protein
MLRENMLVMRMVTVSMKFMLTQWKDSGRYCVPGCALHRGISQAFLPLYSGFFEFTHNAKKRGKALLGSLLELIVSQLPATH